MKLHTKIILYVFTVIAFGVASYITLYHPEWVKREPDLIFLHFGMGICFIIYFFVSILWFKEDLSLYLLFMFKLKSFDRDQITGFYIFMERLGVYLTLLLCGFGQFGFI